MSSVSNRHLLPVPDAGTIEPGAEAKATEELSANPAVDQQSGRTVNDLRLSAAEFEPVTINSQSSDDDVQALRDKLDFFAEREIEVIEGQWAEHETAHEDQVLLAKDLEIVRDDDSWQFNNKALADEGTEYMANTRLNPVLVRLHQ